MYGLCQRWAASRVYCTRDLRLLTLIDFCSFIAHCFRYLNYGSNVNNWNVRESTWVRSRREIVNKTGTSIANLVKYATKSISNRVIPRVTHLAVLNAQRRLLTYRFSRAIIKAMCSSYAFAASKSNTWVTPYFIFRLPLWQKDRIYQPAPPKTTIYQLKCCWHNK